MYFSSTKYLYFHCISVDNSLFNNRHFKVGHLSSENHAVWRLSEASVIPFSSSNLHLTPDERKLNEKQFQLTEDLLKEKYFYFSYTYDLTSSQQRLNSIFCSSQSPPIASLNSQFAWNYNILRPFCAKVDFLSFCVALIYGAVFINNCSVNGRYFRWSLISRRSNRRAGTRFFRRGCDSSGNVANFVETEQIVEHGENLSSFVQTRGSMPFFWRQLPDLTRYLPLPTMDYGVDNATAYRAHFNEQTQNYGSQMVINLVNQTKSEGELQKLFASLHQSSGMANVGYQAYDFHRECSKMRWDRLHILIQRLTDCLNSFGCFIKTKSTSNGVSSSSITAKGCTKEILP